jgi:hypothetical protein
LKGERWGSPLVQGKYREGRACDKRHPYRIIIIIIIIIMKTFNRFTTKDSCAWNITHNTESTAM